MSVPEEKSEEATLEAEIRSAIQHQRAAYEQMIETQRELRALMERARALLAEKEEASAPRAEIGEPGWQAEG